MNDEGHEGIRNDIRDLHLKIDKKDDAVHSKLDKIIDGQKDAAIAAKGFEKDIESLQEVQDPLVKDVRAHDTSIQRVKGVLGFISGVGVIVGILASVGVFK